MKAPAASIIVPVFNGGADLEKCLQAIAASSWKDCECIIVDDASTDDMTAHAAAAIGAEVIWQKERTGPSGARNRGVENASGDVIFFVDADVLVHHDTIEKGMEVLQSDPTIAAVFGSYDDSPAHRSFISQYRNLYHHWIHQTSRAQATTFWTGCSAIRRNVYLETGGLSESFDRPSIEDIEFGGRLSAAGKKIRLESTMQCKHLKPWTFWSVVKTDIFHRGIPWMTLLLANRNVPNDLNINYKSRLATVLAGMLVPVLLLLAVTGHAIALLPVAAFLTGCSVCAGLALKPNPSPLAAFAMAVLPVLLVFAVSPNLLGLLPLLLILVLVWTQLGFYRLALRKHNLAFAFAIIPMQVVFFLCCAISAAAGIMIHFLGRRQALSAR